MKSDRYPADLTITSKHLASLELNKVIGQLSQPGYPALADGFFSANQSAYVEGRLEHGYLFYLLGQICTMMVSPISVNRPFEPAILFQDRRSAIPEDLTKADLLLLKNLLEIVDDFWLEARIADLLWFTMEPRDISFAKRAIDAYLSIGLDSDTWFRGAQDTWGRAAILVRTLRRGLSRELDQLIEKVITALNATTTEHGFFPLQLANLLKTNNFGQAYLRHVAEKLEGLASKFKEEDSFREAKAYFSAAADWYKSIPDNKKHNDMVVFTAEIWEKEAFAQISLQNPSHLTAIEYFKNAIQVFQMVPRVDRPNYQIDDRISKLHVDISSSGEKAQKEMKVFRIGPIDVTQATEQAVKAVSGQLTMDALLTYVNLYPGADVQRLRKSADERIRQYPLQNLIPVVVQSTDGRAVAKYSPLSFGDEDDKSYLALVHKEMLRNYGLQVGYIVLGVLVPALEVLHLEHRLREADFIEFARNSPLIPKDRAGLYGKALFAGYEQDFITALHIVIPQIEHLVRMHLKQAGVKTRHITQDGIELENGLSTLVDLPEMKDIFGFSLTFELKALFCDASGANLRNNLAHGLLTEEDMWSAYAIYAWWLALRLAVNPTWRSQNTGHYHPDDSVVFKPDANSKGVV